MLCEPFSTKLTQSRRRNDDLIVGGHPMANGSDSINRYGDISHLSQKTKEQWLTEGTAHYQVQRYEEALEAYTNVLLLDPSLADVYNRKGFVLLKLRRSEEAFDAFSKARATYEFRIHQHPTDAEAYRIKGHALRRLKCYMDALGVYERLLALNPNLELAWYNKAEMLRRLGRSKEDKQTYATFRGMAQRRGMGW